MKNKIWVVLVFTLCWLGGLQAQGPTASSPPIALPAPSRTGKMSLEEALATRRSVRTFAPTALSQQEISQLLWAAQGVTSAQGGRTAPSAHAAYFLHVYVVSAAGLFRYEPQHHALAPLNRPAAKNALARAVPQKSVAEAPLVLVISGEYGRAGKMGGEAEGARLVNLEAGHATQNVLLEATALGLGAVSAGSINPAEVRKALDLPLDHIPVYAVPVGHPAGK